MRNAILHSSARPGHTALPPKEWINVCPICEAGALGYRAAGTLPFLAADNVMRTLRDFDETGIKSRVDYDFCSFRFSRSSFDSALYLFRNEEPTTGSSSKTPAVEILGGRDCNGRNSRSALKFSKKVCEWGRDMRVWRRLQELNPGATLGQRLRDWFHFVRTAKDVGAALEMGMAIPGLHVSFASKHLRMINPRKYVVLDSILSSGLGFALNTRGYEFFLRSLKQFKKDNNIKNNLATTEAALFMLVRQHVRSEGYTSGKRYCQQKGRFVQINAEIRR